eukprot:COSAG02_NODE_591_length_19862_cov_8.047918_16_plen_174_part_00
MRTQTRGFRSCVRPPLRSVSQPQNLPVRQSGSLQRHIIRVEVGVSAVRRLCDDGQDAVPLPASHTSTPKRLSCLAMASFSGVLSVAPGDCSPSLSVVSKITCSGHTIHVKTILRPRRPCARCPAGANSRRYATRRPPSAPPALAAPATHLHPLGRAARSARSGPAEQTESGGA